MNDIWLSCVKEYNVDSLQNQQRDYYQKFCKTSTILRALRLSHTQTIQNINLTKTYIEMPDIFVWLWTQLCMVTDRYIHLGKNIHRCHILIIDLCTFHKRALFLCVCFTMPLRKKGWPTPQTADTKVS